MAATANISPSAVVGNVHTYTSHRNARGIESSYRLLKTDREIEFEQPIFETGAQPDRT
jgi:hypothetical protein